MKIAKDYYYEATERGPAIYTRQQIISYKLCASQGGIHRSVSRSLLSAVRLA